MINAIRKRMVGDRRRGSMSTLVRSRVGRLPVGVPAPEGLVTLRGFSKTDGTLLWEHLLYHPVLSTDGWIYGIYREESTATEATTCRRIALSGAGAGNPLRIAPTSGGTFYKYWLRRISVDGSTVENSTFFWYGEDLDAQRFLFGHSEAGNVFLNDLYGVTEDGEMVMMEGDNTLGSFPFGGESLLSWDSANSTTTRRYTFVAAAVRDLATVPTGGTKMRFVCENDGTNAEQTIDVPNMIGISAADLATALEAFPHIVSATGTGGPYPNTNIELEIEWAQSTYHFKSVRRLTETSRGTMTWLRDWDTMTITATCSAPTTGAGSTASVWQLSEAGDLIGMSGNPASGVGAPPLPGVAIEKFSRSGSTFTQAWRTRPTSLYGPTWGVASGQTYAAYHRPLSRGGKLMVVHDLARGADQSSGQHCEWHEINLSTGALTANGGVNDRLHARGMFASDSQLLSIGWNSFTTNQYAGSAYQCEFRAPNFLTLTDGLSGYGRAKFGPYGPLLGSPVSYQQIAADDEAIYSCNGLAGSNTPPGVFGWTAHTQKTINSSTLATILTASGTGSASRVSPDSFFSLQNYYRIQYWFQSPINHRWVDAGMDWQVVFYDINGVVQIATDWVPFTADETDLYNALHDRLGDNDAGSNIFVEGPYEPQTADEPIPNMIWQRGIRLTITAEVPTIPWNLATRNHLRGCTIRVRPATANEFTVSGGPLSRVDWNDGSIVWEREYAADSATALSGLLLGDQYVVWGQESEREL
jgi:hypothetical protein